MILDRIGDVRTVPQRLVARGHGARQWVRKQVHTARTQGEDKLWSLQVSAIEGATGLIDRAEKAPVVSKLAPKTRELLTAVERATMAPPLEGYDELNVRKITGALHELDRLGLLRLQRYESAAKARKTILDAVERELERRERYAA